MSNLENFFKFIQLINDFQKVKRRVLVQSEDVWENDLEHSYQLAMAAWYIIDSQKLTLDLNLTLKYALLHDLVEVYAGDTYIYDPDPEVLRSKAEREKQAQHKLNQELPEFVELHKLIEKYEHREDRESKFVYALDKVLPMVNIYLDGGRTWRQEKVSLEMLEENKAPKVLVSPEVEIYYNELIKILKQQESTLF